MGKEPPILVSACLAGLRCRYNGGTNPDPEVVALVRQGRAIPVCPEQLGGLPTPREPMDLMGGDGRKVWEGAARAVGKVSGEDRTDALVRGAEEVLRLVRLTGARRAILKEGSPSCGVCWVYINGRVCPGMGVTAARLSAEGLHLEGRLPPSSVREKP